MPKGVLYVNISQWWPPGHTRDKQKNLWEDIKAGRKTSEFRDYTEHWRSRIFKEKEIKGATYHAKKVDRIWFMVGFPKGNLPRLEADIKRVLVHCDDEGYGEQIEIEFENVEEVTE